MYVGGEGRQREMGASHVIDHHGALLQQPPDILLTNYRMLDLLLLRPKDQPLWSKNRPGTLRYLVLDAGETETLAPEVELQITHAAEMLKRRGGLLAIAGASPGLRDSLGKGGGDRVYSYFASPQGALEFIDDEFTAMS